MFFPLSYNYKSQRYYSIFYYNMIYSFITFYYYSNKEQKQIYESIILQIYHFHSVVSTKEQILFTVWLNENGTSPLLTYSCFVSQTSCFQAFIDASFYFNRILYLPFHHVPLIFVPLRYYLTDKPYLFLSLPQKVSTVRFGSHIIIWTFLNIFYIVPFQLLIVQHIEYVPFLIIVLILHNPKSEPGNPSFPTRFY